MYTPVREFFIMKNIKFPQISSILAGFMAGVILLEVLIPQAATAQSKSLTEAATLKLVKNGKLTVCKLDKNSYEVVKTVKMIITAYSSTPDQTDDTPFITASGKHVTDGIIANNLLPFGTKVRIPSLFGDKVFIVEDRMHKRKGNYHADVWMPEYSQAKIFGAKITEIEVIES
jgi:3D (Asp-Asp-Asp) domain-containing protein